MKGGQLAANERWAISRKGIMLEVIVIPVSVRWME
jgi:hypothetical protein